VHALVISKKAWANLKKASGGLDMSRRPGMLTNLSGLSQTLARTQKSMYLKKYVTVQKFAYICSSVYYEVVNIMFSELPQVYSLLIIMVLENCGLK
jgi:hypothetical protein